MAGGGTGAHGRRCSRAQADGGRLLAHFSALVRPRPPLNRRWVGKDVGVCRRVWEVQNCKYFENEFNFRSNRTTTAWKRLEPLPPATIYHRLPPAAYIRLLKNLPPSVTIRRAGALLPAAIRPCPPPSTSSTLEQDPSSVPPPHPPHPHPTFRLSCLLGVMRAMCIATEICRVDAVRAGARFPRRVARV